MTPLECMQTLGLGECASVAEIKRAYRQLAQINHPDKHGGDDTSRRKFIEIVKAYRILMQAVRAKELGEQVGTCWSCRGFAQVIRGLDGHPRCSRCALQPRRFLPLPVIVVVKCLATVALIAAAVYVLVLAISSGSVLQAIAAMVLGILAIFSLAGTCLTVVYCVDARDLVRRTRSPAGRG